MIVVVAVVGAAAPAVAAPTRKPAAPLNAPGSVTASALSSNWVQISWTDTNTKERGYTVERGLSANGPFTEIARPGRKELRAFDTVAPSTTYFYRVLARGSGKAVSPWSPVVSATTPKGGDRYPPTVPKDVTVQATACDQVFVQWTASTDSSGVKGYNVRRGTMTQFLSGQYAVSLTDTVPAGTSTYTVTSIDIYDNESAPSAPVSITPPPCPGPGSWALRFGGTGHEVVRGTAADASGNVYVVGRFYGDANFGGTTLHNAGQDDAFLAKFASDGSPLWAKNIGGTDSDIANAVAVDSHGNAIVVGAFRGKVSFGSDTYTSAGQDAFVAKFSPAGAYLSSDHFGASAQAHAVAVDRQDNVILGGTFQGTVNFSSPALVAYGGPHSLVVDGFVVKYDAAGKRSWSRQLHDNYQGDVAGVATDATGNIAVTGSIDGGADLGAGPIYSHNTSADPYILMLSPAGQHRWSRSFGDSFDDWGAGVAIDKVGDVVVTGKIAVAADFGGGDKWTGGGAGDVFVAKYSNSGAYRWAHVWGSKLDTDDAKSVAIDDANNIVIAGSIYASVAWPATFGGPQFTGAAPYNAGRDAFVAKYTPGGAHVWSYVFGGPNGTGSDDATGVAVDPAGRAFVAGGFSTTLRFPGTTLTSAGGLDGFLMRLDP